MTTFPIKLNVFSSNDQRDPQAVTLADGRMVVAWESFGQDGDGLAINFRILNPDGTIFSSEIRANTFTTSTQDDVSIAALDNGTFVITWSSLSQDGDSDGIYGQIFDRDGSPLGSEFSVNTYTTNSQDWSSVTGLTDGGFVVTWHSSAQDGSSWGTYQQRYDAFGNRVGTEIQVNTTTNGAQFYPEVSGLQDGGWVVAWEDSNTNPDEIMFQIYNADGTPRGGETQASGFVSGGSVSMPQVTTLNNGNFVVAYNDFSSTIYHRVFDANGTPVTGELISNDPSLGTQYYAEMISLADGGFAMAWHHFTGTIWQATLRTYNADGTPRGDQMLVNAQTDPNVSSNLGLAQTENGALMVANEFVGTDDDISMTFVGAGTGHDDFATMTSAGTYDGLGGDDNIKGSDGNDTIYGGNGRDRIIAGDGDDRIELGNGFSGSSAQRPEIAAGGDGNDTIIGSSGYDKIFGGNGNDIIDAGGSNDLVRGNGGDDLIRAGSGDDTVFAGFGADVVFGGNGNDTIDGVDGDDILFGDAGDDLIKGGNGKDQIYGGLGDDEIFGGNKGDKIDGGFGNDVLTGGGGWDDFIFSDPEFGDDVITDWQDGNDEIDMRGSGASGFGDLTVVNAGANALVLFGDSSITLLGAGGQIDASDFIF